MKENKNISNKDAIIFFLAVLFLYTWFIKIPNTKENHIEACEEYIELKKTDRSISIRDVFNSIEEYSKQ